MWPGSTSRARSSCRQPAFRGGRGVPGPLGVGHCGGLCVSFGQRGRCCGPGGSRIRRRASRERGPPGVHPGSTDCPPIQRVFSGCLPCAGCQARPWGAAESEVATGSPRASETDRHGSVSGCATGRVATGATCLWVSGSGGGAGAPPRGSRGAATWGPGVVRGKSTLRRGQGPRWPSRTPAS